MNQHERAAIPAAKIKKLRSSTTTHREGVWRHSPLHTSMCHQFFTQQNLFFPNLIRLNFVYSSFNMHFVKVFHFTFAVKQSHDPNSRALLNAFRIIAQVTCCRLPSDHMKSCLQQIQTFPLCDQLVSHVCYNIIPCQFQLSSTQSHQCFSEDSLVVAEVVERSDVQNKVSESVFNVT